MKVSSSRAWIIKAALMLLALVFVLFTRARLEEGGLFKEKESVAHSLFVGEPEQTQNAGASEAEQTHK